MSLEHTYITGLSDLLDIGTSGSQAGNCLAECLRLTAQSSNDSPFLTHSFLHVLKRHIVPCISARDLISLCSVNSTLSMRLSSPAIWREAAARHLPFRDQALEDADINRVRGILRHHDGALHNMMAGLAISRQRIGELNMTVILPLEDVIAAVVEADWQWVCMLDARSGQIVNAFSVSGTVKCLAFSPDGTLLTIIASRDSKKKLFRLWWSVYTVRGDHQYSSLIYPDFSIGGHAPSFFYAEDKFWRCITTVTGVHTSGSVVVTVSPDGCHLGATIRQGSLLRNAHTGKVLSGVPSFGKGMLKWSKCGRFIAGASMQALLAHASQGAIFDVVAGTVVETGLLEIHDVFFAPNSHTLACLNKQGMTLCTIEGGTFLDPLRHACAPLLT